MTEEQLILLIDHLRTHVSEKDWFEFKVDYSDPIKLGENLSGVANAACVAHQPFGYVVFGVRNDDHKIVGTSFRPGTAKVGGQALMLWLSKMILPDPGIDQFSIPYSGERLELFRIAAAAGHPVGFKGQAYIRIGSSTTNLKDHDRIARSIWNSTEDWSAKVCAGATHQDLDDLALIKAREQFRMKHPTQADHLDDWSNRVFLDKAKVTIQGTITNTALLLLGKPESSSLLAPAVAQITWFLKNDRNEDLDYGHFGPPFILEVDRVLAKIRNLKVRILPSGTLFPKEFDQYDNWVLHEALHNCIAHQDHGLRERIQVIEKESSLRFENAGSFIPGSVQEVIQHDTPPSYYRNRFLAQAMVNLNMIDTQGGGIRRMFLKQKERSFAMPDFDLTDPSKVKMRLEGKTLDEAYARMLLERTDLTLDHVILLDRVQRHRRIQRSEHQLLKAEGLVEGRYPNLFVSGEIARATGNEVSYVRSRGLEDERYVEFIMLLVHESPQGATRKRIDDLITPMLPGILTMEQKKNKVHNLIQRLSREGRIRNGGARGPSAVWLVGV